MALFIKVSSLTNDELLNLLYHFGSIIEFYREYFEKLGINLDNSWSKPDGYDEILSTYVRYRNEYLKRKEEGLI